MACKNTEHKRSAAGCLNISEKRSAACKSLNRNDVRCFNNDGVIIPDGNGVLLFSDTGNRI